MWTFRLTIFFFLLAPFSAQGNEYDTRIIHSQGAWAVSLTEEKSTGEMFCSAETSNNQSQWFSISTHENGTAALLVSDDRWNLAPRDIAFIIEIDSSPWNIQGQANAKSVSMFFNGNDNAGSFLEEVASGAELSVLNADRRRVADFSLFGSRLALTHLMDCWSFVSGQPSANQSDPFSNSNDPFN